MAKAFIITEHGNIWNEEGVNHALDIIRNKHDDHSEVEIYQGVTYNNPKHLAKCIEDCEENVYIFISHRNGIELLFTKRDIQRMCQLLKTNKKSDTSWHFMMKTIGLIQ